MSSPDPCDKSADPSQLSQARDQVAQLSHLCVTRHLRVVTAESCTGGLIATLCTELAGSSAWFQGAQVTYQIDAKIHWLRISPALIRAHGVVSEAVARAMVTGVLANSSAHLGVALTGIAGPGGGSAARPVGTVWIAWAECEAAGLPPRGLTARQYHLAGDREAIREQAANAALAGLVRQASGYSTLPS